MADARRNQHRIPGAQRDHAAIVTAKQHFCPTRAYAKQLMCIRMIMGIRMDRIAPARRPVMLCKGLFKPACDILFFALFHLMQPNARIDDQR